MARRKSDSPTTNGTGANLGFEAKLWLAADKLRNNMDAAEYKHVVLGLIFLKYISDTFDPSSTVWRLFSGVLLCKRLVKIQNVVPQNAGGLIFLVDQLG
jgi:hypothetical protein